VKRPHRLIIAIGLCILASTALAEGKSNYEGFWKWNCEDPFGLQIIEYRDGLYSVNFCGPGGGCNEPVDEARLTPIEGDPDYEVISATEIQEKTGDTVYGTLYKCTDDTHPVLAYSAEDEAEADRGVILAITVHVAYFAAALLLYRSFLSRKLRGNSWRRRALKSAVLAALFAPGIAWAWPFAAPTFAIFALILSFIPALLAGSGFAYMYFAYAAIPMLVFGSIVFVVLTIKAASARERTTE